MCNKYSEEYEAIRARRRDGLVTIWEAILWGTFLTVLLILMCILLVFVFQTCHTKYLRWQGRRRRDRARKARLQEESIEGEESEMALMKPTGPTTTNATRENKCAEIKDTIQQKLAVPKEKQKPKNVQDCNGTVVLKPLPDGRKELSVKYSAGKKVGK